MISILKSSTERNLEEALLELAKLLLEDQETFEEYKRVMKKAADLGVFDG